MSLTLTICVVNYNGERYLTDTLQAMMGHVVQPAEILLIDNASLDRSVELVEQHFPQVRIIQLAGNHGPGAARNAGFAAATSDRILFVDNDVELTAGCVGQLYRALDQYPRAAIAMPRVVYAHDPTTIQYDGAGCHFLGLMTLLHSGRSRERAPTGITQLSSVVTACFLLDRRRWGAAPPFDEDFFFDYEDHDFGIRARIQGNQILSVPTAVVLHREGTPGLSWRPGAAYSRRRIFCLIRNRWLIILKNYQWSTILLLAPMFAIYECVLFLGMIKKGWIGEWFRAVASMIAMSTTILRKRRQMQHTRVTSDRGILQGGPLPFNAQLAQTRFEQLGTNLLNRLVIGYWQFIRPWL